MDATNIRPHIGRIGSSNYHSGVGGPSSDTLPHELGRNGPNSYGNHPFLPTDESPLRDSSTVGNIYAHYLSGEDEDTDSLLDELSLPSPSRHNNRQRGLSPEFTSSPPVFRHLVPTSALNRTNRVPPNFSLPHVAANQHLTVQHLGPSSSQAISHSSSYGDTGILLDADRELQYIPALPSRLNVGKVSSHDKVGDSPHQCLFVCCSVSGTG